MEYDVYEMNELCVNRKTTPADILIRELAIKNCGSFSEKIKKHLKSVKKNNCDLADGLAYLSRIIDDLLQKPIKIANSLPDDAVVRQQIELKFKKVKELDTKISRLFDNNQKEDGLFIKDSLKEICPFNIMGVQDIVDVIDKTIEVNQEMKEYCGQYGTKIVKCGYLIDYFDIIDGYINSIGEFKSELEQLSSFEDIERNLDIAIRESSIKLVNKFEFFTNEIRDQSIDYCNKLINA